MTPSASRVTVDSLPEELLRDIMLIDAFTLHDWSYFGILGEFHDPKAADGDVYDVKKKMVLSEVSQRWRRVALSNARLWASFRVGVGEQQYSNMIEALVERSRAVPLNVILFMGCQPLDMEPDECGWQVHPPELYERIIRALIAHAARIRTLRVDLRGPVDGTYELLGNGVAFPMLRELRITRDFDSQRFKWEEDAKHFLWLSLDVPQLKILDLVEVYPAEIKPQFRLLHPGIEELRIVDRLEFSADPAQGLADETYMLPEHALPLLFKVFSTCPALRSLSVEGSFREDVDPHPGLLEHFPLRCLQKLALQCSDYGLIDILDSLSHVFIPDITVILEHPIEFDLESDDGHPLLARLMRGMQPIVAFDIVSYYKVTLRDSRGNCRTMGTETERGAEYVPADETDNVQWKHKDLWNFLARQQNLRDNVRVITVTHRSWLAWAAILESASPRLDVDELRIADGAWVYMFEDTEEKGPNYPIKLLYELMYRGDQSREMQSLRFGKLGRVVLELKDSQYFRRSEIKNMLAYVDCESGSPSQPLCCCGVAGMLGNKKKLKLEKTEWPLCDRQCVHN